ncbi:hypothetical protein L218DRAFT_554939 [Marasmius fiardii PR-910]|nr:hypothetical protein L218DRAFT_554939 [Marasmius fiardii PR-910]
MKYLIREAGRPVFEHFMVIPGNLMIAGALSDLYATPNLLRSPFLEGFLKNDASRRITLTLLKLANPKNHQNESPFAIASFVQQCLDFLIVCFTADTVSLLDALDAGLILSILKLRDSCPASHSCINLFERMLRCITTRLYYRAVLVRIIRSLKKMKKKGFDIGRHFENYGPVRAAWMTLVREANLKHGIYKMRDDKELGWYDVAVCGYKDCPYRDSLSSNHKFKRCGGCKFEIYCSVGCQKKAWKALHRQECRVRKDDQGPSSVDLAYLRKCVYHDFLSRYREVWRVHRTKGLVVLMDYRPETGMNSRLIPISEAKSIAAKSDEDAMFSGVAIVPWDGGRAVTMTIYSRSRETMN